jgi:hypothetical protein
MKKVPAALWLLVLVVAVQTAVIILVLPKKVEEGVRNAIPDWVGA